MQPSVSGKLLQHEFLKLFLFAMLEDWQNVGVIF
jgi:hypothetical protein